jgi:hypothetical protein
MAPDSYVVVLENFSTPQDPHCRELRVTELARRLAQHFGLHIAEIRRESVGERRQRQRRWGAHV